MRKGGLWHLQNKWSHLRFLGENLLKWNRYNFPSATMVEIGNSFHLTHVFHKVCVCVSSFICLWFVIRCLYIFFLGGNESSYWNKCLRRKHEKGRDVETSFSSMKQENKCCLFIKVHFTEEKLPFYSLLIWQVYLEIYPFYTIRSMLFKITVHAAV